ncbi:flagellar hook-basal body complex protein [Cupriavidus sp. 30B13]|uniref:flagellar hook-basal body complex protein n=1 Tax=Cupriavidus sp. 30B13 TaxID=3384241 RepID=UPI003B911299
MLDSIYIGMTGLMGYSEGLKVIANNTANMNTPGFKSSTLQFGDLLYTDGKSDLGLGGSMSGHGFGLSTFGTTLNFNSGELRQTGNSMDLAVDGLGLFMLQAQDGSIRYTRSGQFDFNDAGELITRTGGLKVFGIDAAGNVGIVSVAGARTSAAKATGKVSFTGNLSSTATEQTVGNLKVFDVAGVEHALSLKFTNGSATTPGSWAVSILDGTTEVGNGTIQFTNGSPSADTAQLTFSYTPPGQAEMSVTLDFSKDVTSFASGNLSTLAASGGDGTPAGTLANIGFDENGFVVLTYSNGESTKGDRLLLGRFDSSDAIKAVGDNLFMSTNDSLWHQGVANSDAFGGIKPVTIEISNVDLSQEFSDLVIMQRGYQASSQVISTANDMLQELFTMKSQA